MDMKKLLLLGAIAALTFSSCGPEGTKSSRVDFRIKAITVEGKGIYSDATDQISFTYDDDGRVQRYLCQFEVSDAPYGIRYAISGNEVTVYRDGNRKLTGLLNSGMLQTLEEDGGSSTFSYLADDRLNGATEDWGWNPETSDYDSSNTDDFLWDENGCLVSYRQISSGGATSELTFQYPSGAGKNPFASLAVDPLAILASRFVNNDFCVLHMICGMTGARSASFPSRVTQTLYDEENSPFSEEHYDISLSGADANGYPMFISMGNDYQIYTFTIEYEGELPQ